MSDVNVTVATECGGEGAENHLTVARMTSGSGWGRRRRAAPPPPRTASHSQDRGRGRGSFGVGRYLNTHPHRFFGDRRYDNNYREHRRDGAGYSDARDRERDRECDRERDRERPPNYHPNRYNDTRPYVSAPASAGGSADPNYRPRPCRFFATRRGCRDGASCRFAHIAAPHRPITAASYGGRAPPPLPSWMPPRTSSRTLPRLPSLPLVADGRKSMSPERTPLREKEEGEEAEDVEDDNDIDIGNKNGTGYGDV